MSYQLQHGQTQAVSGMAYWDQIQTYVSVQAGVVMPFGLALFAIGSLAALLRGDTMLVTLGLSALGTFAFFLLLNGMAHWTLPAYLSAAMACGVQAGQLIDAWRTRRRLRLAAVLTTGVVLLGNALPSGFLIGALVHGALLVPVDSALVQELVDPTLVGPPLGKEVTAMLAAPPYAGAPTYPMATSYETAALAAFYTRGHPRVYGDDHQYGLWPSAPTCGACQILWVAE